MPQYATPAPSRPPAVESSTLSVSSCRSSRARRAPSASRTAISRCRPLARASSRPATLAHAISSSSATALIRIVSSVASRSRCSFSTSRAGSTRSEGSFAALHIGWPACSTALRKIAFDALCACAMLTPGCSRPSSSSHQFCIVRLPAPQSISIRGIIAMLIHRSCVLPGVKCVKRFDATPTIVKGTWFS